ncbi:MAG: hypothetical protein WB573_08920 [Terracidiphilus sp.]
MTTAIETAGKPESNGDCVAPRRVSAVAVLTCAWPALLLATVCLLPYLNKAFLVDDPHFLTMAQQIVKQPLHPKNFVICWNTYDNCMKASQLTPGNDLMGYVLVPTVLGGAHEWIAHLTQLALVWIAVLAMTSLVFRFGWDRWHAAAGALMLVATAPFLPMASTAMPDILATALALVAMERLAAWKAEQKWSQGAAAAVALGLAAHARSHLLLLLPVAAFFLLGSINPKELGENIRRHLRLWSPVIAGVALYYAITFAVRELGSTSVVPPAIVMGSWHIAPNLFAYLGYFAFPLPLAACWLASRLKPRRAVFVFILLAVAFTALVFLWSFLVVLSFAILGLCALTDLLFQALKRRDHIGLFLLLWVLIPLPIVYYSNLPMKYLLPCIPAVILLCFRLLDGVSIRFARAAAVVFIICGTGYSLLILHADAEFANFGRDALARLITPHVEAGEKVWFPGQYWSYWYAPLDGATLTFPGGPQPKPGDLLVVDVYAAVTQSPLARFPHRTLVEVLPHKYQFGRTMGAGKGLYSNGSGIWMWGFGQDDKDRFELWRID